MIASGGKRGIWFWALILLSATYLCCELAFNSQLLDVVGTVSHAAEIRRLETEGRLISAAGLTLIVFSWLMRQLAKGRFWASLFVLVGVAASAGPAMFYGEKALVNYIARVANTQVRQHASDLLIMKKGLASGEVTIRGIPYHSDHPTPTDKTFLSLSGALVFSNPQFLKEVALRRRAIVRQTARGIAIHQASEDYRRYQQGVQAINSAYDRYFKASESLMSAIDNAPGSAMNAWAQANDRVVHAYHRYLSASRSFNRRMPHEALDITLKLRHFFAARDECFSAGCRQMVDDHYLQAARHYFASPPPWTYWCNALTRKAHGINFGTVHLDPSGIPINLPLSVGWGKRVKTGQYRCNLTVKQIQARLTPLAARTFARKVGAPPNEAYSQFIQSPGVRDHFIREAKARGIDLPRDWRLTERGVFLARAASAIQRIARGHYRRAIEREAHGYLRPGLGRRAFERAAVVQRQARKHLSWPAGRDVRFDLSEKAFQKEVVVPAALREGIEALRAMELKRDQLGNGQRYASDGEAYVKEVIIPPIALSFSLFFGLLNLLNLGKEIAFGLAGWSPSGWVKRGVAALTLSTVLIAPFAVSNPITRSPAYHTMLSEAHTSLGVLAWPFGWIMRAEPVFYPFGSLLKNEIVAGYRGLRKDGLSYLH